MPTPHTTLGLGDPCWRKASQRRTPPAPAMASPTINWLEENDDVSEVPTVVLTVVVWLDLAATAVPTASAPMPTIIFTALWGSLDRGPFGGCCAMAGGARAQRNIPRINTVACLISPPTPESPG